MQTCRRAGGQGSTPTGGRTRRLPAMTCSGRDSHERRMQTSRRRLVRLVGYSQQASLTARAQSTKRFLHEALRGAEEAPRPRDGQISSARQPPPAGFIQRHYTTHRRLLADASSPCFDRLIGLGQAAAWRTRTLHMLYAQRCHGRLRRDVLTREDEEARRPLLPREPHASRQRRSQPLEPYT